MLAEFTPHSEQVCSHDFCNDLCVVYHSGNIATSSVGLKKHSYLLNRKLLNNVGDNSLFSIVL